MAPFQPLSSLVSLPPATRALTALLVGLSGAYWLLQLSGRGPAGDWLVLQPGRVLWRPWTLATSAFVEPNLIELLVSLFTLPLAGRYLERVWGQAELLKFVAAVVLASNAIAVVVNLLESFVLGDAPLFLYGMSYHGLMGLQVGFLVAFTQLIPEHQVQVFGGLAKVRVKSLPMLYVTLSNVACLLGYQSPYILIQFGWLASWVYLRFVKFNEGGEFRGDRSETFSFKGWFPPFAQKYVEMLSTFVFNLAVKLRLLSPWTDIEMGAGHVLGSSTGSGGAGGARAEAERRRAMALKALDQRMATKPSATPPPTSRPAPPTGEAVASSPPSLQAASGSGTTEAKVTVE